MPFVRIRRAGVKKIQCITTANGPPDCTLPVEGFSLRFQMFPATFRDTKLFDSISAAG
jgi:hypothetical protein